MDRESGWGEVTAEWVWAFVLSVSHTGSPQDNRESGRGTGEEGEEKRAGSVEAGGGGVEGGGEGIKPRSCCLPAA